jgi:chemotaxis protein methyltransferase CheR
MLLSNRLRRRLRQTQMSDFEAYYRHLKKLPPCDPEWDAFLQEITTHETYRFRDEAQWEWFRNDFLAEQSAKKQHLRDKRPLRIWSAACSTGDEATTAACCIAASLSNPSLWLVEILGTDIGAGALEQARSAVFGERAAPGARRSQTAVLRQGEVPDNGPPSLSGMIRRQRSSGAAGEALLTRSSQDVLIYFDAASKKTVLENVRGSSRAAARGGGRGEVADLLKASAHSAVAVSQAAGMRTTSSRNETPVETSS